MIGNYIYSILVAVVFTAVIYAFVPEKHPASKYVGFIGALAIALTIVTPLTKGLDLSEFSLTEPNAAVETEEETDTDSGGPASPETPLTKAAAKSIAQAAARLLETTYGIAENKIVVHVTVDTAKEDEDEVQFTNLVLEIPDMGRLFKEEEAEALLYQTFGIETDIRIQRR